MVVMSNGQIEAAGRYQEVVRSSSVLQARSQQGALSLNSECNIRFVQGPVGICQVQQLCQRLIIVMHATADSVDARRCLSPRAWLSARRHRLRCSPLAQNFENLGSDAAPSASRGPQISPVPSAPAPLALQLTDSKGRRPGLAKGRTLWDLYRWGKHPPASNCSFQAIPFDSDHNDSKHRLGTDALARTMRTTRKQKAWRRKREPPVRSRQKWPSGTVILS